MHVLLVPRGASPFLWSCFKVGVTTILQEFETQGLAGVEAVGDALEAETNSDACRPEIAAHFAWRDRKEVAV